VRCFTRDIPDLQKKYAAIGSFIQENKPDFLVEATCLTNGIKVNNSWYPVIKMNWVEGDVLNQYISKNITNPLVLKELCDHFFELCQKIEKLGVGHGDLQHGNIIVKNERLCLVDYDGMYLPSLSQLQSNEIGHPNYQHPMRNESIYTETMDHFSSIAIWFSLKALSIVPDLWKKYQSGDNILFSRTDYLDPEHSRVFSQLSTYPQLKDFADRFKGVCFMKIDQVPTLEQFIAGNFSYPSERQYSIASMESKPFIPQPVPLASELSTGDCYTLYPNAESTSVATAAATKSNSKWVVAFLLIGFLIFSFIPLFPVTVTKKVPYQESYQEAHQVPYQESYQVPYQESYQVEDTSSYRNSWGATGSRDTTDYASLRQSDRLAKFSTSYKTEYRTVYRTEYRTVYRTEYQTAYRTAYRDEQYTKTVSLVQLLMGSKS
jgi:hypothetical protein